MANRPPRLDFISQSQPLFFVTFNTYKRACVLAAEPVLTSFVNFARDAGSRNIAVGRYVIMPDHIHLFVRGDGDFDLEQWIRMLKRHLSNTIDAAKPHWQKGFFDHVLRHDESYAQKWEYVRGNPVRAGLVREPDEWAYQGEVAIIDRA